MKIYLDDVRDLPVWMVSEGGWVIVRSGEELLKLIEDHTLAGIEAISFDNDLGDSKMYGYQVLDKIEEMVHDGQIAPALFVHTANYMAAKKMYQTILNIVEY